MPTLDDLRTEAEAKLEKILARLDERHKAQLRAAIKEHGWNVPDSVWQEIQQDQANEELAAAILLLMTSSDEWTTDELGRQGVRSRGYSRREFIGYGFEAQRRVQDMAAGSTDAIRSRLRRRLQDEALSGRGGIGEITDGGIDDVLDAIFTDQRREARSIDQTTGGFTHGQRGAAGRAGGGTGIGHTIALLWRTERDNLVCPRCAPLEGQPEEVWSLVFPEGPGRDAHPNCRCWLEPKVVPFKDDE